MNKLSIFYAFFKLPITPYLLLCYGIFISTCMCWKSQIHDCKKFGKLICGWFHKKKLTIKLVVSNDGQYFDLLWLTSVFMTNFTLTIFCEDDCSYVGFGRIDNTLHLDLWSQPIHFKPYQLRNNFHVL